MGGGLMHVDYKKNLRHNYMVISKEDNQITEQYCSRLLQTQIIDGFLPMEQRYMDDKIFYDYDITAKQSMSVLFEKTLLTFASVMQLFQGMMEVFDQAYEYLLPEDSFVITPECIYLEFNTKKPYLCFVPGYSESMKKQINTLLEYLMNKVDYNDKKAVLLVYQLYAASREEGFSVDQIPEILKNPSQPPTQEEKQISGYPTMIHNPVESKAGTEHSKTVTEQDKAVTGQRISELFATDAHSKRGQLTAPKMKERIESEKEISCYPIKNLILVGVSVLGGILALALSMISGIVYNSFGNRIDYSKLLALLLITLCTEGYVIRKLLDRKSKTTKLVKVWEYIDPAEEAMDQSHKLVMNTFQRKQEVSDQSTEAILQEKEDMPSMKVGHMDGMQMHVKEETSRHSVIALEEEDNPTCLLNAVEDREPLLLLKACGEKREQDIIVTAFPFYIGKQRDMDYCMDSDVVSRYHAKITMEDEGYYITDLNSTNGTFINTEALMTYQKKEICIGDEIAFANMKYILTQS